MRCRCYEPHWNEHIYEDVAGIDAALLEIIHKSIFLKYIHEYYAFIYLLMYLYPSGISRFAYKARKFDSEWRNNSF